MHLQDSYYAEMTDVGTGTQIGYNAPASNTFTYGASTAGTWTATSTTALNDCQQGAIWQVVSAPSSTNGVSHTATTPTATADACAALTPSFTQIGAATH